MPDPASILGAATFVANRWIPLAIAWHAAGALLAAALLFGWRPTLRVAGFAAAAPLASVAVLAWTSGNAFTGAVVGAAALALIGIAARFRSERVDMPARRVAAPGSLLIAFGWAYPHFLIGVSWPTYLFASPLGLLPCPTLSVAVGWTLIAGLYQSPTWSATLGGVAVIYGAIGVVALGVALDYVLVVGALVLFVAARRSRISHAPVDRAEEAA